MINIHYPPTSFRYKASGAKQSIFDEIRKQFVMLTPEEWVRQNFVQYLLQVKKYPAALINVEKEILLGELKKRCDIIIYNQHLQPWMIVECKAPEIPINEKVLEQLLRYNIALPAAYLILTNGNITEGYHRNNSDAKLITNLPDWPPEV
jgi:hypothetical protein